MVWPNIPNADWPTASLMTAPCAIVVMRADRPMQVMKMVFMIVDRTFERIRGEMDARSQFAGLSLSDGAPAGADVETGGEA